MAVQGESERVPGFTSTSSWGGLANLYLANCTQSHRGALSQCVPANLLSWGWTMEKQATLPLKGIGRNLKTRLTWYGTLHAQASLTMAT